MSSQNKLNRVVARANARDKKRQTKMRVSGKSVFTVARLLDQSSSRSKRKK